MCDCGVVDALGDLVLSCAGGVDGSGSSTSGKYVGVDGVLSMWSLDCVVAERGCSCGRAGGNGTGIAGAPGGAGGCPEGAEGTCRSPDSSSGIAVSSGPIV